MRLGGVQTVVRSETEDVTTYHGATAPARCPMCDSRDTRIVGQSGEPPMVHRRCEICGEVFSRALH